MRSSEDQYLQSELENMPAGRLVTDEDGDVLKKGQGDEWTVVQTGGDSRVGATYTSRVLGVNRALNPASADQALELLRLAQKVHDEHVENGRRKLDDSIREADINIARSRAVKGLESLGEVVAEWNEIPTLLAGAGLRPADVRKIAHLASTYGWVAFPQGNEQDGTRGIQSVPGDASDRTLCINLNTGEWLFGGPLTEGDGFRVAASVLPGMPEDEVDKAYAAWLCADPGGEQGKRVVTEADLNGAPFGALLYHSKAQPDTSPFKKNPDGTWSIVRTPESFFDSTLPRIESEAMLANGWDILIIPTESYSGEEDPEVVAAAKAAAMASRSMPTLDLTMLDEEADEDPDDGLLVASGGWYAPSEEIREVAKDALDAPTHPLRDLLLGRIIQIRKTVDGTFDPPVFAFHGLGGYEPIMQEDGGSSWPDTDGGAVWTVSYEPEQILDWDHVDLVPRGS